MSTRGRLYYLRLVLHHLRAQRAHELLAAQWEETERAKGLRLAVAVFSALLAARQGAGVQ